MDHQEKLSLYHFLMQHGFVQLQRNQFADAVPGRDSSEVKEMLEEYRKLDKTDSLNTWITHILNLKLHYKLDSFGTIFGQLMNQKTEEIPADEPLREVYSFLGQLLAGEFPNTQNLSDPATTTLLLLFRDLNELAQSVNSEQFISDFTAAEAEQQNNLGTNTHKTSDELVNQLRTLFKFEKLSGLVNPLSISTSNNKNVWEAIFNEQKKE